MTTKTKTSCVNFKQCIKIILFSIFPFRNSQSENLKSCRHFLFLTKQQRIKFPWHTLFDNESTAVPPKRIQTYDAFRRKASTSAHGFETNDATQQQHVAVSPKILNLLIDTDKKQKSQPATCVTHKHKPDPDC